MNLVWLLGAGLRTTAFANISLFGILGIYMGTISEKERTMNYPIGKFFYESAPSRNKN